MALFIARHRGLSHLRFESAGTHAIVRRNALDPRVADALRRRGIQAPRAFRTRRVEQSDFDRFDRLLAMDLANLDDLLAMSPPGYRGKVGLLLDLASGHEGQEVPDPYFAGPDAFDHVYELCQAAIDGLVLPQRKSIRWPPDGDGR